MDRLLTGYARFRREIFPAQRERFSDLSRGQQPDALFITCADSRIVPNLITQTEAGEIFVVRNVGNIVPPHGEFTGGVSSAIEYAVIGLNVRHIVILGHSDCGAMKALLHPEKVASMKAVTAWLHHSQAALHVVRENCPDCTGDELLRAVTEENVVAQLDHLRTHPSVAARLRKGALQVHGWIYEIAEGRLSEWDAQAKGFAPLEEPDAEDVAHALVGTLR
jgi:carbonic anhydrase